MSKFVCILLRAGEMTAADTLARVVRSSALPFDASHRALCARAHLRWAKGSALVPHHVPTAVEQTSYSVAASAARKALEFTLSSSQQGSAESSSGSSDSLSMTNIPADPAGRALLIECVAIDESDAAAEALIYRIEHQALRDQQRTVAGGSNSAELSHSYALNAVALSAWTVLVERACRRGDLGNAARLIGLVNERMNEWVRRLRATSIEASDAAIAAVLEADEPDGVSLIWCLRRCVVYVTFLKFELILTFLSDTDLCFLMNYLSRIFAELESSTDGIAPSDHLWSYWRAHRAFLAALCSNPLHVDSAIAHLGALESVAAVDVSQSSSQFSSESSNAKLASSSAVGMLKSLPTSLSRLLRNATSDGVDEPISAEEAADIIRHDIAQRIAGLKVSAPQHIPLHAAVAIPVLRTWIEANQSKRALSWVLANSNSTVKSNMNPRGTSLASHDLKLPHCAAIFHLFYDRAVRSGCQSDHGDSKPSHALSSTVDILSAMRERGIAPTPAFFTSDIQAALSNGQSAQTATTDSEHAAVANATRILDALPAVGVRAEAAAFDAILTRLIDHHSNVAVRTILESTGTASLPNTKARAKSSPNSNTSSNTTLRMEPDQAAFDAMLAAVTRTLQTAVARRACFDARLFATAAQRLLAHADRLFDTMRKGNPSMSSSSSTSASVSTVQQVANSAAAAELSRVDAALDRLMTALEDARLTPTPVRRSSAPVYASVISHLLRRRRQLPAAERVLHRVMAQHRRAQASPLSQASGKPGSSAGGVAAAAAAYVPVQPTLGLLEPFLGVYVSDRGRVCECCFSFVFFDECDSLITGIRLFVP